jgi:phosphatidylglycerophosphate synthase
MGDRISDRPNVRIVAAPAGGQSGGGQSEGGSSAPRFFGLTGHERLVRALKRAGLAPGSGSPSAGLLLVRDDYLYDEMLLPALCRQPGVTLIDPADRAAVAAHLPDAASADLAAMEQALLRGQTPVLSQAGLRPLDPIGLASSYNHSLRKRTPPYLVQVSSEPAVGIERRMFDGAYKGVTDFVTKRIWPWPAFHVTRLCARVGLTPNMVTSVSAVLMLLAMWWFWQGQFAAGLAAAWGMCFLDTVDGKLARATLRSSPFGNVFDHGIDLIHPPFWYWAWHHGLMAQGAAAPDSLLDVALVLVIAGYVGGRLQEGIFELFWKIQMHTWRPVDSFFREITARRNPNLFLLMVWTAFGDPRGGLIAVAAWTAVSFVFHTVRILQAIFASAVGRAPSSWLREPAKAS